MGSNMFPFRLKSMGESYHGEQLPSLRSDYGSYLPWVAFTFL